VLHYVPFHALHDGHQYVIDRYEISYCPSAGVFKLCSEKAERKRANGRMLIMAVPDETMPFIREEVEAVRSLWPDARVFLGPEATLDSLKQHAPGCRFLHLASHAVFRRDNPMFSALKLGDAWLSFYDIFNLDLHADMVTLSACETGMNEIFPGDELFGLMRGFLYAGAPSLVVSLWQVNDRSTAEFMRWLYVGLSQGLSKRAALRQAQLKVKQAYPHPYYWAPFILVGSPE
jgi:CHAT domain-containing protein